MRLVWLKVVFDSIKRDSEATRNAFLLPISFHYGLFLAIDSERSEITESKSKRAGWSEWKRNYAHYASNVYESFFWDELELLG